jgi:hypothetical protein
MQDYIYIYIYNIIPSPPTLQICTAINVIRSILKAIMFSVSNIRAFKQSSSKITVKRHYNGACPSGNRPTEGKFTLTSFQ